jgi:hypothetical protein
MLIPTLANSGPENHFGLLDDLGLGCSVADVHCSILAVWSIFIVVLSPLWGGSGAGCLLVAHAAIQMEIATHSPRSAPSLDSPAAA